MLPSYNDTIGCTLQDLPHSVIEARGSSIQRPIDLTPVQPTSIEQRKNASALKNKLVLVEQGFQNGLTVPIGQVIKANTHQ
jgi:hypothetical protein